RRQAEHAGAVPLVRFPQLMAAPILVATIWNGLWSEDMLDPVAMFEAFLDLAFGQDPVPAPQLAATPSPSGRGLG
ncbi:MAG TPA: hypothetical protein VE650_17245, partial [Acetobacteraceae bacterium]|nr:hypothetical protein [Acetobacteraceae bacterium]